MDINKALRTTVTTGKVYFGIREARKALKAGSAKLVIFSSNCPQKYIDDVFKFKKVSTYNFKGTNTDLGSTCGKPFPISVLTVIKPGKSNILQLK
jgi:large subunit ribosomal protein L30e